MRVKVRARRETVNPLNIVAEAEVVVKKREILGHCLNCDFFREIWGMGCDLRVDGSLGWGGGGCLDWHCLNCDLGGFGGWAVICVGTGVWGGEGTGVWTGIV